ncbi:Ig-like domain-containing protein [Paenibacillus koleovorans]|uniref:Ig-like domain-containing protein n=1 Tax=Paenibacillus koleovorans TaxID=121608 RepID=UPI000FD8EB6D|nr:Ig-like domain-containing protein [Paenibacillus koleovorans]
MRKRSNRQKWIPIILVFSMLLGVAIRETGTIVHAEEVGNGDIASETFDGVATGSKPVGSGWSYAEVKGTIGVAELPDATDKSLKISRTESDTAGNLYARKTLDTAVTGQAVFRTKVRAEQTDAIVMAGQLRSTDNKELAVLQFAQDGKIKAQLSSGTLVLQSYTAGVWYDISTVIDTAARQYSVWVDGVLRAGPIAFKDPTAADLKKIDLQVFRTTVGTAYYNDFNLYTHSVSLNKSTATLAQGNGETLTASVLPAMAGLQTVTWTSSNSEVVRVDANGQLIAMGAGTAIVTAATIGGAVSQCVITVPEGPQIPVTGVTVSPVSMTLYSGESGLLTAALEPFYATNRSLTWVSSSPSVVSVVYSVYGTATVTGLLAGESIVTVMSEDGAYTASSHIVVKTAGDVFSESFNGYAVGTKPGTLSIPTATGVTAAVYEHAAPDKSLRIEKPGPTASTYLVGKTVPAGNVKMKVSIRAMASQTNAVINVARIRNSANTPVVDVAFYANGNIAVFDNGSWKSVQPYEANRWYDFDLSLNAVTGQYDLYIDGVLKGNALPMLAAADEIRNVQFGIYGPSSGTASFDDLNFDSYKAVTGVELDVASTVIAIGSTSKLSAVVEPAGATFPKVQWTSSNPAVLAVDQHGQASALAEGTSVVTATTVEGSFTDSVTMTAYVQHPDSVSLHTSAFTLPVESDYRLLPTVMPSDSSDKRVTWSSSNPAVATVNEEGLVHGTGLGTAQITVSTVDGGKTASSTVTVIARNVQTVYYVSPTGDDSNPGTLAFPFKTIQKARDVIRTFHDSMTGDIEVYLRGGKYNRQETLVFDERDSGGNGYWVIYKAYEDEKPVIEGGRPITGWTLYDAENNIYAASAGGDIETRQLYVNGIRAVRARSEGGLTNPVRSSTGYTSDDTSMAGWGNISDLEFVYKAEWTNPRGGVQSVTVEDEKAVFTMKQPGWMYVTIRPTVVDPWYIENAYELLDEDGEWYLDRTTDTFYYKPRPGENMSTAEVIAPVVEELVKISGTSLATPVQGIHFEGLTFSYTTWLRPSSDWGHADAQNNLLRYGIDTLPISAVTVEKASQIRFERNEFSKLGIIALKMVNGVQESLIRGNHFFDISGSAIDVGDPTKHDREIYNPSDPRKLIRNVDIVNNYIHNIGVDYRSSAAIGIAFPIDMEVSHNEIFDVPYDGISIGYGLAHVKTSSLRNAKLHANFIHDIMGEQIYDGGAIYTLGGTGGTADNKNQITENYLRNQKNRYGVIYNDEGSTFWHVEGNVIDATETPIWDEIFPVTWAFVNGPLTSHDITFQSNYTTTGQIKKVGVNVYEYDTRVYPNADWPTEALAIIANSGLEPAYQDLRGTTPERIVLPKKLDLATEASYPLNVSATTGKDVPVSLSGATVYYTSDDESIAQVDASGNVEAIGPGTTKIWVHVRHGELLKHYAVPVYVDDAFDHIEVYYTESKIKHVLGDEYSMVRGGNRQLSIEAKSLYGQKMTVTDITYSSSSPTVIRIEAPGLLTALVPGEADIEFSVVVEGVPHTKTVHVTAQHYGNAAGLEYDAYPIDAVINDPAHWYVYPVNPDNLVSDTDLITITTPSGFATYQGSTFGDELLTMDILIEGTGGWPSLVLRSQQPNQAFTSLTNDLYLISFKPDVIELQRFNGGARTIIYGNINGYTSIGGPAIPNNFLPFGERHRVQVGAVNESGGVRLILNIDGENIFYFLDTETDRIEDDGYFGLYARSGSITLLSPEEE